MMADIGDHADRLPRGGDHGAAHELLIMEFVRVGRGSDPVGVHREPDAPQQLVGCAVVTTAGEPVGVITDVRHHGQDLLVIRPPDSSGRRGDVLVPFVAAIAVDVDIKARRMVIDPPPGLLDLPASPG